MTKILITGISGFVGSTISIELLKYGENIDIIGIDNLSRYGSEKNIPKLTDKQIKIYRGDIRCVSDINALPKADWVIDCAANPSVLAGISGNDSSRQLMEHNLLGTINLLEYCKLHKAGLILLSTSRVYSASSLGDLSLKSNENRFEITDFDIEGLSYSGIAENFPTTAPISLYGVTKLASEQLILEYAHSFDFPVWINRCGVLAGAGQFGKADQGIFSFWIHSYKEKRPLKYIGFGGNGHQVRDALHPHDLVPLLSKQMTDKSNEKPKIVNLGGGLENSLSLKELSHWCEQRFGESKISSSDEHRPMDAPWIVMDTSLAYKHWNWRPTIKIHQLMEEIALFADRNPEWMSLTT